MHRFFRAALLALCCLASNSKVLAAPGEPDPSFGSGGVSRVPAAVTNSTRILATARQPDGKILVAGEARASEAWSPFLAATARRPVIGRLNADGSLDASFGMDGWIVVDSKELATGAGAAAITATASGKVIVGIQQDSGDLGLVGLTAEGAYDPDFGYLNPGRHIAFVPNTSGWQLVSMVTQSDGMVLMATSSAQGNLAGTVYRFDSRGGPDSTFGQSGAAQILFNSPAAGMIQTLYLRSDGGIFVGGWVTSGPYDLAHRDFVLVKLTENGALDSQFGVGGKVTIDIAGGRDEVQAIAEDAQGRLILAGQAGDQTSYAGNSTFGLVRLDAAAGALDTSFGAQGKVLLDTVGSYYIGAVTSLELLNPGGDLLLGGYATRNDPSFPNTVAILARLDSSGHPVATFGTGGVVSSSPTSDYAATGDVFRSVFVNGDAVLAVGSRSLIANLPVGTPPVRTFALRQVFAQASGASRGDALTGQAINAVARIALNSVSLPDGRALVVGSMGDSARVTRILANGLLDVDFGQQGNFTFQIGNMPTAGRAIAIDPNGNILVASVVANRPGQDGSRWSITRWNPDGVLDSGFGNGDAALNSFDDSDIVGLAVQTDGKVVVAGTANSQFVVVRFNADGTSDSSFNGSGVTTISSFYYGDQLTGLAIQPDGRILVAGYSHYSPSSGQVKIARFTASGVSDTTWGGGGIASPSYSSGLAVPGALSIQADGKLVIGATCFSYFVDLQPRTCIFRLESSGDTDYAFGMGGLTEDTAGLGAAFVTGIGMERDGKIIAGGDLVSGYPFALRLNRDGSLDTGYNGAGSAQIAIQSGQWTANIVDADGKMRLLGYSTSASSAEDLLLVQLQGQTEYGVPDPFEFPDAINVPVGQVVTSVPVTIGGINVPARVSVSNGEYAIGCAGNFTSADGTISNGQSVCVRHLSSMAGDGWTQTRLTIGSVEGLFNSRTGTLPETSIGSAPPALAASRNATFTFASTDGGATFRCSLDAAAFASCASPASYGSLAEGDHRFRVLAVNGIGADATPAERVWRVDVTSPQTVIESGPSGNNNWGNATFTFSSNEAATFECRMDGGPFAACTSPTTYAAIPRGLHGFEVRARDLAGNIDATPATRAWRSH